MIEANELLGSFDSRLREYAARRLTREGVQLVKGVVKEVRQREVELQARGRWGGLPCFPVGVGTPVEKGRQREVKLQARGRRRCQGSVAGVIAAAASPAWLSTYQGLAKSVAEGGGGA